MPVFATGVKTTGIRVDGMKELQETLMQLPLTFREKVAKAALAEAAQLTKVAVEAYAPVDTGLLQQSIKAGKRNNKQDPDTLVYVVFVSGVKRSTGELTNRAPTSSFGHLTRKEIKAVREGGPYYWYYLEFGTSKMAPHPFMLPAFESSASQALAAGRDIAKAKTEREMNRIARLKK